MKHHPETKTAFLLLQLKKHHPETYRKLLKVVHVNKFHAPLERETLKNNAK
jgi:sugar (pentulose or hexulose) kinase